MTLSTIAIFCGIGMALGVAHFCGLRRDTRMYLVRGLCGGVVAAHAVRLLATAAAFLFIARSGAIPLLAALAGFLAARFAVVARMRRSA